MLSSWLGNKIKNVNRSDQSAKYNGSLQVHVGSGEVTKAMTKGFGVTCEEVNVGGREAADSRTLNSTDEKNLAA